MINNFEEMILLGDNETTSDIASAQIWFNNMTVFIDFIKSREQSLGNKVRLSAGATIRRTRRSPRAQDKGAHKNYQRGVRNIPRITKERCKTYQN